MGKSYLGNSQVRGDRVWRANGKVSATNSDDNFLDGREHELDL